MSAPAIRAEGVSKQYRLGASYGYKTLREGMTGAARRALRRPGAAPPKRFVWALKDVSFEIEPGELVGIIGANGAGKTTILKVFSRITNPTAGWAEVRGRVGSLLEVGTGFHPELTGRENVLLNGAILGMGKADIMRRFDEIVAFADLDQFLDTPIKRYSSGMKVRLAFAVAAHLEPDILIVDEVLAVGDLAFQKKCLGKMGEVTSDGRTVLFVSHNMSLIRALCERGILLQGGSVVVDAPIEQAVHSYLQSLEHAGAQDLLQRTDRGGWQQALLSRVEVLGSHVGNGRLVTGDPARFIFHVTRALTRMSCTFTIFSEVGHPVTTLSSAVATSDDRDEHRDDIRFECAVDEVLITPGRYRIDVTIEGNSHLQDHIEGAAFFEVEEGPVRGRPIPEGAKGDVVLPHRWRSPHPELSGGP
jgi:lipopolysaccharide transport system ATP-binding protein